MCGNQSTFALNGPQIVKWFAGTAPVKPNDVRWISGSQFKAAFPSEARGFNYTTLKLIPIVDHREYAVGAIGSSVRPITRRVVFVETDKPTKCGARCRNATGSMCDCSCKGDNHGAGVTMSRTRFATENIDLQPTQQMADIAAADLTNFIYEKAKNMKTGSKATMAKREYVLWALPKGETDRMHEKPIAYNITKPADMERIKVEATKRGYHSFRVQVIEWARSGVRLYNSLQTEKMVHTFGDGWEVVETHDGYTGGTRLVLRRKPAQGFQSTIVKSLAEAKQRHDTITNWIFRATVKEDKPNEFFIHATPADGGWSIGNRGGEPFKTRAAAQQALEKRQAAQRKKAGMSRSSAKAEFAANNVDLWNYLAKSDVVIARQNASDLAMLKSYAKKALAMPDFTPPALSQNGPSLHEMAKNTLADIKAFEEAGYRQRNRAPWSRSGAKAAFDAFDPFTAPAKPASWDGKRIKLNDKMYKVEPNGGAYDLYDMNTNKKAKTMTAEQLYRAWEQGRIKTIYNRSGAKAAFAEPQSFRDLVAYARFHFNLNLYQAQDVAGRAGIFLTMHPNKYPFEMVMQEALKRSNSALTAEQKSPDYRVGSNIKGNPTMRDSSLVMSRHGAKAAFADDKALSAFLKKWKRNEAENAHSENVVLLAQFIGSSDEIAEARDIMRQHDALGHLPSGLNTQRYALYKNLKSKLLSRYPNAAFSRSGAKAMFAEELIQKLSGGWEIVKIDGILHLAKGNEAIPVPSVQRAMELHKASTEGRLMKQNVAGTKTTAFSRFGMSETEMMNNWLRAANDAAKRGNWEVLQDSLITIGKRLQTHPNAAAKARVLELQTLLQQHRSMSRVGEAEAFELGAASESDDPTKDETLIALANRVGREHTVNLFKCWSEGKASMQRAATMFSANMYYSVQATVGNNAVGERTAQTVEEAKRFAYSMLDAAKQNAQGKTVVVDVIPVKNYEPQASVLTLRG